MNSEYQTPPPPPHPDPQVCSQDVNGTQSIIYIIILYLYVVSGYEVVSTKQLPALPRQHSPALSVLHRYLVLKTAQIQTSWLLTKQLIRVSSGFYTVCKKYFYWNITEQCPNKVVRCTYTWLSVNVHVSLQ